MNELTHPAKAAAAVASPALEMQRSAFSLEAGVAASSGLSEMLLNPSWASAASAAALGAIV